MLMLDLVNVSCDLLYYRYIIYLTLLLFDGKMLGIFSPLDFKGKIH